MADQRLQTFHHKFGVATATHHHVALEQTVIDAAVHDDARLPAKVRAQRIQRGVGGHEFDGRGRVHGLTGAVA